MKINWKKIKKYIKLALVFIGMALTAILAYKVRKAIIGKVDEESNFWTIPGDDNHIRVVNKKTGKLETVKLPDGVSSKKVRAVELDKNSVKVEVLHEQVDRRNTDPIDNSALDRVRRTNS